MLPFELPSFTHGLRELRGFLEDDPSRIDMYGQRPFGVLIYRPAEEFQLRAALEKLEGDLAGQDRRVRVVSFADLAQHVIGHSLTAEGIEWSDLDDIERQQGLQALSESLVEILDDQWALAAAIVHAAEGLRPERDALILTRAGFLYPHYRVNPLLEALGNFSTMRVATVLCYPGVREGETGLSFMGQQEALRGYRQRLF